MRGAFDHFLGKGDELHQKVIQLPLSGIRYRMCHYQTNFSKKALFLKKIVKNHLIDKNSKIPKNDRSSGSSSGGMQIPPDTKTFGGRTSGV